MTSLFDAVEALARLCILRNALLKGKRASLISPTDARLRTIPYAAFEMPRFSMRPILLLSGFLLCYHWAFGLSNLTGGVQRFFSQTSDGSRLPISNDYDFSKPYKKRIVAIGGERLAGIDSAHAEYAPPSTVPFA